MKKVLLVIISLFITYVASAQIKAVTENGDTINVYENKTWERINKATKISVIETTVKATVKVDEFKNSKTILTEKWRNFAIDKVGNFISGSLLQTPELLGLSITYSGDLGCLSEYSGKMEVKLANGDIVEFFQISDTDCSSSFQTASFIPTSREDMKKTNFKQIHDDNIELLKQYDWALIRLYGSKYNTTLTPNTTKNILKPEQFFRQHIIAAEQKQ